jgi:hypothetical protein
MPIYYIIKRTENIPLELLYEMASEGLLIDAGPRNLGKGQVLLQADLLKR